MAKILIKKMAACIKELISCECARCNNGRELIKQAKSFLKNKGNNEV